MPIGEVLFPSLDFFKQITIVVVVVVVVVVV